MKGKALLYMILFILFPAIAMLSVHKNISQQEATTDISADNSQQRGGSMLVQLSTEPSPDASELHPPTRKSVKNHKSDIQVKLGQAY